MTEITNVNPNLYALLIGIDCYLPNRLSDGMSYRNLRGSVRDINYVEKFLLRQPQKPTKIFKLTSSNPDLNTLELAAIPKPKEPEPQLPTYKNIVAHFQQLTDTAAPGDLVYIQYCGHGGRAKTNYPQIKGENGIDEGLVPVDIGTGEGQYLRDLELAKLLQNMVDKGLVVTLVLDCCHAAGFTRGEDTDIRGLDTIDETPRQTPSLVASADELTKYWLSLTQEELGESGGVRRKATAVASMLPEVKGYVLLAACRPSEYAYEYAFERKKRNGALTYWLLDTLNQPMPGMTYKMVHDRISAKIKTLFPLQTPMLMGEGDRLVFGSEYLQTEYAVNVMQVRMEGNTTKVKLNAGQAQGLRKGAEFAIYPLGLTSFSDTQKRFALVEITELEASYCWAEVTTILKPESVIEQGAQAVLTSAPVRLVKKVRLLTDKELPIERNAALQAVEMALTGNGWLELVGEEEAADYQVDVRKNIVKEGEERYQDEVCDSASTDLSVRTGAPIEDVIYEICDRTGAPIVLRPVIRVKDSNAAEMVVQRLVHLAKYQGIQELDNHDASSPLRGKVVVELLGTQKDYDPADGVKAEPFTDPDHPEIKAGEYLLFRIRNNYFNVINVAVLDLQSDWAIDQVSPKTSQFIPIEPGQEEFIPVNMSLTEGEYEVEDILKVFATIGMANFRWLELPALDQPILSPEARGVSRSGGTLDELLMAFAAEQPPTRKANPVAFPSREWTTLQVRVKTKGDRQNQQTESKSNDSTVSNNTLPNDSYSSKAVKKVLVLAANPKMDLRLDREIREIDDVLRRSMYRDQFKLESKLAVRVQDLQRALSEVKPRIVQFCGHGSGSEGLVLENNAGQQQLVSTEALADLFKLFANRVECVLLNACYSGVQAQAIVKNINYVIGMGKDVRDDAAIAFTVGFYEALGSGESIESAYNLGCNRIQLEINRSANYRTPNLVPVPEHLIPVLLKNPNPVEISSPVEEKLDIPSQGNSDMSNHGGIQQTVSGGTVQGGMQAAIGSNNQQNMNIGSTAPHEKQLTQEEVIQNLVKIEQLLQSASDLPAAAKNKSLRYLEAAKDEAQATEPDKEFAASNLKRMAETLKNANKTVSSTKTLWENIKLILEQLLSWLSVAKNFLGF